MSETLVWVFFAFNVALAAFNYWAAGCLVREAQAIRQQIAAALAIEEAKG